MRRLRADVLWHRSELGALLEAVVRAAKLDTQRAELTAAAPAEESALNLWMDTACAHLGIEAEMVKLRVNDLSGKIRSAAPAILETPQGYLGLLWVRRRRACVIARDLSARIVSECDIEGELRQPGEESEARTIDPIVASCGFDGNARARAVAALLREKLKDAPTGTLWQLRTVPGAGIWRQLRETGLARRLFVLIAAHTAEYALWLAAWWVIGQGVLQGRIDRGWMTAWVLLLITIVPCRILSTWSQGLLAIGCGGLLRQRLLAGALQLDPSEIRNQGAGQLLGRTFEAETVESLALAGGIASALAVIESGFALVVMAAGSGGALQVATFGACTGLALWLTRRCYRRRSQWTEQRLAMTHDLVEKMTGYRTRLAQQLPEEWHAGEDQSMDRCLAASREMDHEAARLAGLLPRAWLLVGIAALAPAFLGGASPTAVAIGIGGMLLAYRALHRLVGGASQLAGAWIAWRQVARLFHAASRRQMPGAFVMPSKDGAVLDARQLVFSHAGRAEPVLKGASCTVHPGDWVLLEGPSGGGKSTVASLLSGIREPSSGLLLAGGLDRRTLGASAWRRMVAAAPQYHENHVFSGTMAFNLLMGRAWPPSHEDLKEAAEVCSELGLDALLDRMPGGMDQMVGETGWQLSQGERSRLFLARALLQNSRMVILDETFAALDPENLRQAMECALRRSKTLMVIAHP